MLQPIKLSLAVALTTLLTLPFVATAQQPVKQQEQPVKRAEIPDRPGDEAEMPVERKVPRSGEKVTEIYDVTKTPMFPGGEAALLNYMTSNLVYPDSAKIKGIQGVVVVAFVVEKDGQISEADVLKDLGTGCGTAAQKMILGMPKWIPGEANGVPVRVRYTLPVRFSLKNQPPPPPPPPAPPAAPEKVYEMFDVQTPPTFPGGEGELMKFISKNLEYPADARKNSIQGTVVLRFVIEKTGAVGNVTVAKSVYKSLDDAAKAVIQKTPNWMPAQVDGHPVACIYTIPVRFKLQ